MPCSHLRHACERLRQVNSGDTLLSLYTTMVHDVSADLSALSQVSLEDAGDALSGRLLGPYGVAHADIAFRRAFFSSDVTAEAVGDAVHRILKINERRRRFQGDLFQRNRAEVARLRHCLMTAALSSLRFHDVVGCVNTHAIGHHAVPGAIAFLAAVTAGYTPTGEEWSRLFAQAVHSGPRLGKIHMPDPLPRKLRLELAPIARVVCGRIDQCLLTGDIWLRRKESRCVGQTIQFVYETTPVPLPGRSVPLEWNDVKLVTRLDKEQISALARLVCGADSTVARLHHKLAECAKMCLPPEGQRVAEVYEQFLADFTSKDPSSGKMLRDTTSLRGVAAIFSASGNVRDMARALADRVLAMTTYSDLKIDDGEFAFRVRIDDGILTVTAEKRGCGTIRPGTRRVISRIIRVASDRGSVSQIHGWSSSQALRVKLAPNYVSSPAIGSEHHAIWSTLCEPIEMHGTPREPQCQ